MMAEGEWLTADGDRRMGNGDWLTAESDDPQPSALTRA